VGTNRDYLYRTVAHLASLGISDGPMQKLERRVRLAAGETQSSGEET
jgi:cation transport regulator ChaC